MSQKYKNTFKSILKEEESISPADLDMGSDEEAFNASFDNSDYGPDDFNTDPAGTPGLPDRYVEKAKDWVKKLQEFSGWLNGIDGDSLNKQLNEIDKEGSIFRGIAGNSGQVVNASKALNDIAEALTGVVLSAPKKQRELDQQDKPVIKQ